MRKVISENRYDIREVKKSLRARFKSIRHEMSPDIKKQKDTMIFSRLTRLKEYIDADIVITYVSTPIEVDTQMLINHSLKVGKTVAVPKCIDGTRDMVFYKINSLSDLSKGTFSVLEPDDEKCTMLTDFTNSIMIVPALAYDLSGYRLGYGGGYYDRFIGAHTNIFKIGIEYCCCTVNKLHRGRYDLPVELLVTEKYIKTF